MADQATKGSMPYTDPVLNEAIVAVSEEMLNDAIAPSAAAGDRTSPEERFARLDAKAGAYLSLEGMGMVRKAYRFAEAAHAEQKRKSGEPYISHPIEVALILSDLRMDAPTLCAALLHDTVEDTSATFEQLSREFSEEVAQLVEGVTKITQV